ncbi:unnamed protein product [Candida verbasci]|uniref:Midasin n=1 Tax=Candida verbasci TaxID=1227364 RepID=A0A9W4U103_9ASCO|nr:unnamed protein product [Candida verbasci]
MNDEVIINLDNVERSFSTYKSSYSQKKVKSIFKFNKALGINENLNNLSLQALDQTLLHYYCYKSLFLEIIARWIQYPEDFETEIKNSKKYKNYQIKGSIILSALSRLINISIEYVSLFEHFLNNFQFLKQLGSCTTHELESILLAYYRLIKFDVSRFKKYIIPKALYEIIRSGSSQVSKFLSIQIISIYLQASELSKNKMIDIHLEDKHNIISTYEGDKDINYYFIALLEAKRASNFLSLPQHNTNIPTKNNIIIKSSNLSPLIASVCGVLVPNIIQAKSSAQEVSTFVPTKSAVAALRSLAQNIQFNKPVLLYGKAGAGKTFLINQLAHSMSYTGSIVKIHLGEQTDAKLLLGTYASGEKPGTFEWKTGVLTSAVQEGKWVLIEDIDKAPTEVLSILLTLLEKRELSIPSRGEVIRAKNGFQLFSTIRISNEARKSSLPDMIGLRQWELIKVELPNESELKSILYTKFPLLSKFISSFIKCFTEVVKIYSSTSFISLNKGSHPRVISFRDLMKLCARCNRMFINEGITQPNQLLETTTYENIFAEAVDCFGSSITETQALIPLINSVGESLEIPTSRIQLFLNKHAPLFLNDDEKLKVGRALLKKSSTSIKKSSQSSFARTNHSLKLMEQIGVALEMVEPVLLVGETGTGKTTVVQQVAKLMNKKLTVINVSQQTESGDLLGGYKPVNSKSIAIPIQEYFENLFIATFSEKKNEKFSKILTKCFNKRQWKNVTKLWKEAFKMAKDILSEPESEPEEDGAPSKKKRKLKSFEKSVLLQKWLEFENQIKSFEMQSSTLDQSFVFNFVEGSLVKAVRNGEWLLLDELNLATSDTLESIADLLADSLDQRSILLTERGDTDSIKAHPDFRIFGCMNPSTDVGKRDLPLSIRSRFTEIYVHSPDRDIQDLLSIIDKYIGRYTIGDEWVGNDIAELYLKAKSLSDSNKIVDGANQKPHFSIRTLTRTLVYVCDIVPIYGLRRSLYEGFSMSFLTLLDAKSEELLKPEIFKYTVGKMKNSNSVMSQIPPAPTSGDYVQFRHYWMKHGPNEIVPQPHYIITPFVEKNMLNLVRATAGRRFPVLIQGPTSAGKTSMINYLASITGHNFVRINNHEHTDLQEYLGTYVSDSSGKLVFKEGILVEALRKGYWIVLDELNLAPSDVLEALNRLLDDNRELFVPETQEIITPHPDFMLFATQNPPGLYGGRKMLSRAFRNRFLELNFDDIPQDELEIILRERCKIAPSYGKNIVEVYRQLSVQRQSTRLFEQKNSFATLRDLFRWALRDAVGYEELAANGYMLLAERVRKEDEKEVVRKTIEKVMKVKLDMDEYYRQLEFEIEPILESDDSIVWTKAMRRLAVLVYTSIKYKEPLLLVGETGCGKTTVCQIIAKYLEKNLVTVNAHQNTETGDLLGAQRPVRNKFETQSSLFNNLIQLFQGLNISLQTEFTLDNLLNEYKSIHEIPEEYNELVDKINEDKKNVSVLFEWIDGPLIRAMKEGDYFLLDEISLADDSVLERLNSVLEPERSILLAEKGTDDAFLIAKDGFEFLATMNPGGDYGKKELSPALRNRFTEIWVPSMEDFNDVYQIVESKLYYKELTSAIVKFSEWYAKHFGGGHTNNGIISLRDILAWVEFINSCTKDVDPKAALYHGASMVFIDALGTNNTAYLSENELKLKKIKSECTEKLSEFANADLFEFVNGDNAIIDDSKFLHIGLFSIPINENFTHNKSFNLEAPTTAANAMRVIRAMQVQKPILLEGSPGVGKTSLVTALAKATGNNLIRINLSEQTDLVDLFGSDAPAESGKAGEFVWRDAPFLRAMQRGEWVLLDEMNLASQSVLEGLNACLDHRGEAYIPELDKSFKRHPKFTVFAAQNPQYQGGGRKGLPKSFINRFTVVYVDILKSQDLNLISRHLYPTVIAEECSKLIKFMSLLEEEVIIKKLWGSSGGPWEFNLRDTLRWLGLYSSGEISQELQLSDFVKMIVCQRFRNADDRGKALKLFEKVFGPIAKRDNYFTISESFIQSGGALVKRNDILQYVSGQNLLPLQCNFELIETAFRCIVHNIPLILSGPTNSGKTDLIRFLATSVGAKLDEFSMNSDVDSMDILGGYEQVDLSREMNSILDKVFKTINETIVINLVHEEANDDALIMALDILKNISDDSIDLNNYSQFHDKLIEFSQYHLLPDYLLNSSEILLKKLNETKTVKFEWFDGLLVKAVEKGNWLILDNANLCSPSVLDRLNSLLETNGTLIINECSLRDGQPRELKPHPNFRLFLTMDPKYGELSRAMRNRGIEVYMEPLNKRASFFDSKVLNIAQNKEVLSDDLPEKIEELKVHQRYVPTSSFAYNVDTNMRPFSLIEDVLSFKNDSSLSSLCSLIPMKLFDIIEQWKGFVDSSTEFVHELSRSEIIENLKVFMESNLFEKVQTMYNNSNHSANQIIGKEVQFGKHQSSHPSINMYVTASFVESYPTSKSFEATAFYEVIHGIVNLNKTLVKIEFDAMNKKIHDLTFIESSAAFVLGRNIKSPPRLHVYSFIKLVYDYVCSTFLSSLNDLLSNTIYEPIYELIQVCISFIETAHEHNESKLRIYQDLIVYWSQKYENLSMVKTNLSDLKSAVDTFGGQLQLNTGLLINEIWENYRGVYPQSIESWNNQQKLISIIHEIDVVSKNQYHESVDTVTTFAISIEQLYKSIVSNDYDPEELNLVFEKIEDGVTNLTSVSDSFITKRFNKFKTDFAMISNYIKANNGDEDQLLELYIFANDSMMSLFKGDNNKIYPSVLDSLWYMDEGNTKSSVSTLFTNELILSVLDKSINYNLTSGKLLDQTNADLYQLSRSLVNHSNYILKDQKETFANLLKNWILSVLESQGIKEISFDKDVLNNAVAQLDSNVATILTKYIIAAYYLLEKVDNEVQILGKAWILFSCGMIQLFVPNTPYDPAIKEYVLYKVYEDQKDSAEKLVDSWRVTREVANGDNEIYLESTLRRPSDLTAPSNPKVYRDTNTSAINNLFEEWNSIMDSSIDVDHVEKLLKSVLNYSELTDNMIQMFQNNTSQFLLRMQQNYFVFSDLNDILRGYIYGLKLGFDLINIDNHKGFFNYSADWSMKVADFTSIESVKKVFPAAKKFAKSISVDNANSELLMSYFMRLAYASKDDLQFELITQSIQSLYYRWSLRRIKEEKDNIQQGSMYKYNDQEEDAEQDFKNLFPDFEDVLDLSEGVKKNNKDFETVYENIASAYIKEYLNKEDISISELVQEGCELVGALNNFDLKLDQNDPSAFASLLDSLSRTQSKFTKTSHDFNFYQESNIIEVKKANGIMTNLIASSRKLLDQWPEHATLRNIVFATNEFLSYPIGLPLGRYLQKLEQIYTFIAEWQKYASSQVSLKDQFDILTNLIVSWRKLELSTWKALFSFEEKAVEKNIGKWWFHLLEVIIIPMLSDEEKEEDSKVKILSALNVFMSKVSYGEFNVRLNLLKAFKNHSKSIDENHAIVDALSNFIEFYSQFESTVFNNIEIVKKQLEKDVNEVILLASWKDVNIDSLKQSAKRSHNNLYKVIKKYRALLHTPVQSIIEQGLSVDIKPVLGQVEIPLTKELIADPEEISIVKSIPSWIERPSRLQNIAMVDKNMKVYIDQISSEELPQLLEFADELVSEMERLKKETPSVLKEDNKKIVANLKTQKRKLLSDTLKDLRRAGLKLRSRSDILSTQGSVNLILANSISFDDSLANGCDSYFFRILDLLPRLRSSVTTTAEDVPQVDVEKGLAAAENLIHSLIVNRVPLKDLAVNFKEIDGLYSKFFNIAKLKNKQEILLPVSVKDSIEIQLESIEKIVFWLPKLLDYAIETIVSVNTFSFNFKPDLFYNLKQELSNLKSELDVSLLTNQVEVSVQKFLTFEENLITRLRKWQIENSKISFIGDVILNWFNNVVETKYNLSNPEANSTITSIEKEYRDLSTAIIVAVQKTLACQTEEISRDDDFWLISSQTRVAQYMKNLHIKSIISKLKNCIEASLRLNHNEESSNLVSALASFTYPLLNHYFKLCSSIFEKAYSNYSNLSKAAFILSNSLYTLATKGFCSPEHPQEQKNDNNLQEGTGLGDGEGINNNSNDVQDDEDLTEDAQQANQDQKEKDEGEENENDDAVDIESDMAGNLEDASDQENDENEDNQDEQEDLDEEIDDIDDLDPNAIDEKMWDEEAKEDTKEKDADKLPDSSNKDENIEANENENEKKQEQDNNNEQQGEEEQQEEGDDNDEELDVGEQEDEVKNQENEQLDEHVPETETLDLPEDMNLDGDEEEEDLKDEEDHNDDDKLDDLMNDDQNEKIESDNEENNEETNEEQLELDQDNEQEDQEMEEEEETKDQEVNAEENETNEEVIDSEDETVKEDKTNEKEEGGNDQDEEELNAEGVEGSNDIDPNDIDMDAATKQETGEKGEGADNQVMEENDDLGAAGNASLEQQQQEDQEDSAQQQDESREKANESLKQLGDSLKEFHRRKQEIVEAKKEEKEEKTEESANQKPEEFQHVDGENADYDTQALGAADNKDQVRSIDEDKAIDDEDQSNDIEIKEEPTKDEVKDENMDEIETNEENPDVDFEGESKSAFIGERKSEFKDTEFEFNEEIEEDDGIEHIEIDNNENLDVDEFADLPPVSLDKARELWRNSELATQELASGLCEQLRLILEPTLATKLRGDYKTGKRLNMKRIIPYIASDFKKDKIWLKRTKPSKRQYQIMIAVDDSKSMSESKSTELAFHSIALVSKALSQLESGGLSIVRFGEDVKVVHSFDKPFNSNQETGAKVFQWFDFQQTRTNMKQLCNDSLQIFEDARSTSNTDLWQLQIILSDGVCEDHETILRMVRKAREEKIMMVFVVIDGINSKESIMDMQQVSYVTDPVTNQMNLKVDKYLDSFPFDFYVVVKNINELPEMLSLILRQYFSEVSSNM